MFLWKSLESWVTEGQLGRDGHSGTQKEVLAEQCQEARGLHF